MQRIFRVWMLCVGVVCECGYGWMHMWSSFHTHSVLTHSPIHTLTHTHSHPPTPTLTSASIHTHSHTHTLSLVWCCKQHLRIGWFIGAISGTWTCIHRKNIFIIHWKRLIRPFRSRKILTNALYLKNDYRNKRSSQPLKWNQYRHLYWYLLAYSTFSFSTFSIRYFPFTRFYISMSCFSVFYFSIFAFSIIFSTFTFSMFFFSTFSGNPALDPARMLSPGHFCLSFDQFR